MNNGEDEILKNGVTCSLVANEDWELRQKHATFFQNLLSSVQQSSVSANASVLILFTVGGTMTKLSGVTSSQDWIILMMATCSWGLVSGLMVRSFSRSAVRIEATYLKEYAMLFPDTNSYRLESFLLDFADGFPWLVGERTRLCQ